MNYNSQLTVNKQVIDAQTGEVIQDYSRLKDAVMPDRVDFIENIFSGEGKKSIQLVMADEYNKTPEEVQSYIGQLPKKASEYSGKIIRVIGATPWFSGGFMSHKTEQWEDGYHKMLLKLDERIEKEVIVGKQVKTLVRNVIIATSSKRVAEFFGQLIVGMGYGAYDWTDGKSIRLMIEKDPETNTETVTLIPEDF